MRAVILDIDGTLLESAEDDDRIYRETVVEVLGPVRFREGLHDYDPVTDTAILEQVARDNDVSLDEELVAAVRSRFVEQIDAHISASGPFPAVPGAADFLDRLRRSGDVSVAIATGGWGASARLKLETAGLCVTDLPLASSDDATTRTDIMRIALDWLNGPFQDVTYFGDGHWDRVASAELGWRFQPVGRRLGGIEDYRELPALPHWRWMYDED